MQSKTNNINKTTGGKAEPNKVTSFCRNILDSLSRNSVTRLARNVRQRFAINVVAFQSESISKIATRPLV
jgi:hypothetical protein